MNSPVPCSDCMHCTAAMLKAKPIIMIIIASFILTGCFQSKEDEYVEATVAAVVDELKQGLKDPYSVKLSNLSYHHYPDLEDSTVTVCGAYNAKNSMGAYVGNEDFFGTASRTSTSEFKVALFTQSEIRLAGFSDDYIKDRCSSSTFVKYEGVVE